MQHEQQIAKLQQQLLGLLERQIQDLNSAYHSLASKPTPMEDVLATFSSEAEAINLELQKLPTPVCVSPPTHASCGFPSFEEAFHAGQLLP